MPRRWGGLIDLPGSVDNQIAQGLQAALTNSLGEDQIAVRGNGVFARRLVPGAARVSTARTGRRPVRS